MYCLYPYTFKRDGEIVTFPCGKCLACCAAKQRDWIFRIEQELKANHDLAVFVTLTYEESNLKLVNGIPVLEKSELQKFLKRLRKSLEPRRIRYYAIGEYGDIFQRPHYHLILFNINYNENDFRLIEKAWTKGYVQIKKITPGRIAYCTKYMFKFLRESNKDFPEFRLLSKCPGIGFSYIQNPDIQAWHRLGLRDKAVQPGGHEVSLPRYFKQKLFSPGELRFIGKRNSNRFYERAKFKFDEVMRSEDPEKIKEYSNEDIEELARQKRIISKFRLKQLQKKQHYYEHIRIKQNQKAEDK